MLSQERVGGDSSYQEVLGHRLVRQLKGNKPSGTTVCEGCKRQVRGIIRQWYMCKSEWTHTHICTHSYTHMPHAHTRTHTHSLWKYLSQRLHLQNYSSLQSVKQNQGTVSTYQMCRYIWLACTACVNCTHVIH